MNTINYYNKDEMNLRIYNSLIIIFLTNNGFLRKQADIKRKQRHLNNHFFLAWQIFEKIIAWVLN